jgi:hypothetical protein
MTRAMRAAPDALDHVLIGAPTLEAGLDWLEGRTGVQAVRGGSHPGLGTWNALASLGPAQYIEIIAPDPAQPGIETFFVPGLRDLPGPRVVTWAVRGADLRSRFGNTLPPDFSCEPARRGSRVRNDGSRLSWTLAFPKHREHDAFNGALPFFIEWDDVEAHPARGAPPGLRLRAMTLRHPHGEALRAALSSLGIDASVEPATHEGIRVELDTPRGVVSVE